MALPTLGRCESKIKCDTYHTVNGDMVEFNDERAVYCSRLEGTEMLVLIMEKKYESLVKTSEGDLENLMLSDTMLKDCRSNLKQCDLTVKKAVVYGDDIEKILKAERIKYGLIGAGAGVVITTIIVIVIVVAVGG